jgi:NitT/TauT family transport system substrate-binding protein
LLLTKGRSEGITTSNLIRTDVFPAGTATMALVGESRLRNNAVVVAAAIFVTLLLVSDFAAAQTSLKFTLEGKLAGPVAPFTVGIDKGYYAAEELNVTIDTARDSADALKRIASGEYDMGFVDINALIRSRDQNPEMRARAVFMVYNRPPYAVIGRKSRGVVQPKDLKGKKLGAPAADLSYAQLPIFLRANSIEASAITVINIGLPVREPMLAAGQLDAVIGISFETYVDMIERGVPVDDISMMLMADYGVHAYGSAIVINSDSSSAKSDAIKAFLRAFLKALKSTIKAPVAAISSVVRRDAALNSEVERTRLELAIEKNIRTPEVATLGYGAVDMARLNESIEQLGFAHGFKTKFRAEDIFDPAFLPRASERRVQ